MNISMARKNIKIIPDSRRVIARFFDISDERKIDVIRKIMAMPEQEVTRAVDQLLRGYSKRHRNISMIFEKHFNRLNHLLEYLGIIRGDVNQSRKLLIGSYFTMEYSIESTAFFNPSIVESPDQSGLDPHKKRVILSFRATGEGHVSSIVFRSAIIDGNNNLIIEPVGKILEEADQIQKNNYDKELFINMLAEMGDFRNNFFAVLVLEKLGESFTYDDLLSAVEEIRIAHQLSVDKDLIITQMIWLAKSHYELEFSLDSVISERVIFSDLRNGKKRDRRCTIC